MYTISRRHRASLAIALVYLLVLPPSLFAQPHIPGLYGQIVPTLPPVAAGQLPQVKTDGLIQGVSGLSRPQESKLVVHQNQPQAIMEWDTFNIGTDAWMQFDQQGQSGWAVLNRIYDANPSRIYGKLTADGQVFLINQNGILFSPGSRINVRGLTASALNLQNDNFIGHLIDNEPLSFSFEDYIGTGSLDPDAAVANHGELTTDDIGYVYLVGPRVENAGTIRSDRGRILLAAGEEVSIKKSQSLGGTQLDVEALGQTGEIFNFEGGRLTADQGLIGIYGKTVNHDGLIRSVTAIRQSGRIKLVASDRIRTGPASIIESPISESGERVHNSVEFRGGDIELTGAKTIEHAGRIFAPAGKVTIHADNAEAPAENRIGLTGGSVIDVSGTWFDGDPQDLILQAQLNSVELRDAYGLKGGRFQGETITFSALDGSAIGDMSGHLAGEDVTARERSTYGGIVDLDAADGEISVASGALIDFSGGGIHYPAGNFGTTQLVCGNKIYDISDSPGWLSYDMLLGPGSPQKFVHARYGIVEEYEGLYFGSAAALHSQTDRVDWGDDAGRLIMLAETVTLLGRIDGAVVSGRYQTETAERFDEYGNQLTNWRTMPEAGDLIIGGPYEGNESFLDRDPVVHEIRVVTGGNALLPITADDRYPAPSVIPEDVLNSAGLGSILFSARTQVSIDPGVQLEMPAGGSFTAAGRRILQEGAIHVPAGEVNLILASNMTTDALLPNGSVNDRYVSTADMGVQRVFLSADSRISVAGERVDNSLLEAGESLLVPSGRIDGGQVSIIDQSADGEGVIVAGGAKIDVSGGWLIDETGSVQGGDGGAVAVVGPSLILEGDLSGYAPAGRNGGSIGLHANAVDIVPANSGALSLLPYASDGIAALFKEGVPLEAAAGLLETALAQALGAVPREVPEGVASDVWDGELTELAAMAGAQGGAPQRLQERWQGVLTDLSKGKLTLRDSRFQESGFTSFSVKALTDVTVFGGANLSPSAMRQNLAKSRNSYQMVSNTIQSPEGKAQSGGYIAVTDALLGDSEVKLAAGKNFGSEKFLPPGVEPDDGRALIEEGSRIRVGPAGAVAIEGPAVTVSGAIEAPAGKIEVSGAGVGLEENEAALTLTGSAKLTARGYNRPSDETPTSGLLPSYEILDGGTIKLSTDGKMAIQDGALIDVSAAAPVPVDIALGDGSYRRRLLAGEPGKVNLSFNGEMAMEGRLLGRASQAGARGGELFIENRSVSVPLAVSAALIDDSLAGGFDVLTLKSRDSVKFTASINAAFGRRLTIDAPMVAAKAGSSLHLEAPWISLANTYWPNPDNRVPAAGDAALAFSADWIDVSGDTLLTGFGGLSFRARNDIRLSDRYYYLQSPPFLLEDTWQGRLRTSAETILEAARIFPTSESDFTIQTAGKLTTLPRPVGETGPIFSAGGSLSIEAASIEHHGWIAAPMGRIRLQGSAAGEGAESIVFLAPGSRLTAEGSDAATYGRMDENGIRWLRVDRESNSPDPLISVDEEAPEKHITLEADRVFVDKNAVVDVSGGGTVFTSLFLPGIEGSVNPITKKGRYVILPTAPEALPGFVSGGAVNEAVTLAGGVEAVDLSAGTYALVPEEYAFLSGAVVLEDLGAVSSQSGAASRSTENYPVVQGVFAVPGTTIADQRPHLFSVRRAADVLKEGNFTIQSLAVGESGSVTIAGSTTILDGTLRADREQGFDSGTLSLSGKNILIGQGASPLPAGFDPFDDELPDPLVGKLNISARGVSNSGFDHLRFGDIGSSNPNMITETIFVETNATLEAKSVNFSAEGGEGGIGIILFPGSRVIGSGESGSVALASPEGSISIRENAALQAAHSVTLHANRLDLKGDIELENSAITLMSRNIYLMPVEAASEKTDGMSLESAFWSRFTDISAVTLAAEESIVFEGDVDLGAADHLLLDADRIGLAPGSGPAVVQLSAKRIEVANTSLVRGYDAAGKPIYERHLASSDTTTGAGQLRMAADRVYITLGPMRDVDGRGLTVTDASNELIFDGFRETSIESADDIELSGSGAMVASGDLDLSGARVVTRMPAYPASEGGNGSGAIVDFTAPDIAVSAPAGSIGIHRSTQAPVDLPGDGGVLNLAAQSIYQDGIVDAGSGWVNYRATKTDIVLTETGAILARGTTHAPGGRVSLESTRGGVQIGAGAVIDVSAGDQGDAGGVRLFAPTGGVTLDGSLAGGAPQGGKSGDFELDTLNLENFAHMHAILDAGGFHNEIGLRARNGDVAIDAAVQARVFHVYADSGDLSLQERIGTGGASGGRIVLAAGRDLTLGGSGSIDAPGGEVMLAARGGVLTLTDGSIVDLSGASGGKVTLQTQRWDPSSESARLIADGEIRGADSAAIQLFRIYEDFDGDGLPDAAVTVGSAAIDSIHADNRAYMAAGAPDSDAPAEQIAQSLPDAFLMQPGVEIRSTGNLSLNADWDLLPWRYNGQPGHLVLRAGGDLDMNASLFDAPTTPSAGSWLINDNTKGSWEITLVAGADDTGANLAGTLPGQDVASGNLTIADGQTVYTERSDLTFASALDTVVNQKGKKDFMLPRQMDYGLGSFQGSVRGEAGRDLIIKGGAIEAGIGDVELRVGRNLEMKKGTRTGSIRTIGQHPTTGPFPGPYPYYFPYENGGDIRLDVGGKIDAKPAAAGVDPWDWKNDGELYSAVFESGKNATRGIAAMAGGDVRITAAGDAAAAVGSFDTGNVFVLSGGSLDGRFLVKNGEASLVALENFGAGTQDLPLEIMESSVSVAAEGGIWLGTAVNPTIAHKDFSGNNKWDLTYAMDSAVSLTAVRGDVTITGKHGYYTQDANSNRRRVLPPTLEIHAGRDFLLGNSVILAPGPSAGLTLDAGRDILGRLRTDTAATRNAIIMSDLEPGLVYGDHGDEYDGSILSNYHMSLLLNRIAHAEKPVHAADSTPATIHAGRDIDGVQLYVPKQIHMTADRDIRDIFFHGQNLLPEDATIISAFRDIFFSSSALGKTFRTGIEIGGPGYIFIGAGDNIDLGTTAGILVVGNLYNPGLANTDIDLSVIAGSHLIPATEEIEDFFAELREGGTDYSNFLASGDTSSAQSLLAQIREEVVFPFWQETTEADGDIDMVFSQIATQGGKGDIFVFADGQINVGKSVFTQSDSNTKNTGIYTTGGGDINIFTVGDNNVNESRLMTFQGGDITVWSDEGNINAGRGSKAFISVAEPRLENVAPPGQPPDYRLKWEPPAVGSGIRTLTFDPDGVEGPEEAPLAGDAFLFAPKGTIDAGEAGISARNLVLGATEVLNAQNIDVSGASVGVPQTTAGPSVGALAGAGTVSETSKIAEDSAAMKSAQDRAASYAEGLAEQMVLKWIGVEVIGFEGAE